MVELAWPWLLLALPLPFVTALLLPRARDAGVAALRLPVGELALSEQRGAAPTSRIRRALALLAWALLVVAAARPQWLGEPEDVPRTGRDLLLAIDTSGSMSIEDMQLGAQMLDRFSAIQAIASDFVRRREGDRVGLILFGSRAYLLTPLTFDLKTVATQLREAAIGLAGRETAIGDAVGLAVKRLRDRPENERVLVLLTDGVNTAGELDPKKAIELAQAHHVRVYTIGIGAESVRVDSLFGSRIVNPSQDLDVALLTALAEKTGGHFYRARDAEELAGIYRDIERLEPAADAKESLRPIDEWFALPLSLALLVGLGSLAWPSVATTRLRTPVAA
jgi:Ca-activated chloride channel family protein